MKVFIQQPVIPEYRLPLFNALATCADFELQIHASAKVFGMPATIDSRKFNFNYIEHSCSSKLGSRLFSQKNMNLPDDFTKNDVVVYNSNPRFLSNMSLVRQARKRNCRVIAWNHASSVSSNTLSSWLKDTLTQASKNDLLVYTEGEARRLIANGWQENSIYFLNNTIDEAKIVTAVQAFSSSQDNCMQIKTSKIIQNFKNEQGFQSRCVGLFCSRLVDKTHISYLIQAVNGMSPEQRQKFLFIIIGDGDAKERFMNEVKALQLEESFRFLGAIYDEVSLAPWFLAADFFVYPGAIGLSLNHAMAYGLPILTHDNSSKHGPEIFYLRDRFNGITFSEANSTDLMNKIMHLSTLDLPALSHNAWATMHETYSFKKCVANFVNCLKGLKNV